MKLIVHTTEEIKGEVTPPASKSQTIRGLIFATLTKGTSAIKNPLHSQDTVDAIRACRALGANIMVKEDRIVIESEGVPLKSDTTLNTGDSGVTTHFLMPTLGLRGPKASSVTLDCGAQMKERPVEPLVRALQRLGMKLHSQPQHGKNGPARLLPRSKSQSGRHCFPLQISGELFGGKATISGKSSQYLSALLISLPCAKNDSVITVNDLQERPYVEMTEMWLREQGVVYEHTVKHPLSISPSKEGERLGTQDIYTIKGGQAYKPFIKTIPGDFSSASYLIAAGALLGGQVILHGLDMNDPQGDKMLVEILKNMGADIEMAKHQNGSGARLVITGGRSLRGIKIDANAIPDMVPTLAVIAAVAKGKTEIVNVANARLKETDRLRSMTEGLTKMGAKIEETKDSLVISGGKLYGAAVHGFNDHRTVMALSLAGMLASGETFIDTAEAVNKTFPDFVKIMKSLGGQMNVR